MLEWQPDQVSLSNTAGAWGDPRARDTLGRGQSVSITLGRAGGVGQCCSVPESLPGLLGLPACLLNGVHYDHRAHQGTVFSQVLGSRAGSSRLPLSTSFCIAGKGKPLSLVPFFTFRLVCVLLLTESICLAEQDCKKHVHVRRCKGFPPCCGWEMEADLRPVLSVLTMHPAHSALQCLYVSSISAPQAACCQCLLH